MNHWLAIAALSLVSTTAHAQSLVGTFCGELGYETCRNDSATCSIDLSGEVALTINVTNTLLSITSKGVMHIVGPINYEISGNSLFRKGRQVGEISDGKIEVFEAYVLPDGRESRYSLFIEKLSYGDVRFTERSSGQRGSYGWLTIKRLNAANCTDTTSL
jgi:hypothetical protein